MQKSLIILKWFIGLFALIAIVACGGNDDAGTKNTIGLGSITLSGNDTGQSGTSFSPAFTARTDDPKVGKFISWRARAIDDSQIIGLNIFFKTTGELFSINFSWLNEITNSGVVAQGLYECVSKVCTSLVHDPSTKTVTFNNVELPVESVTDNNATGPMTLNGALKYQ